MVMRDYIYVPHGTMLSMTPGGPEPLITVHECGRRYEARATWESELKSLSVFAATIQEALAELESALASPPPAGQVFHVVSPVPKPARHPPR